MYNFKRFGVFTLASASAMLESSKEKAALRAAEPLVVGFSCEVEAQSRDFAVALDEELAHAPGDEVFVNLDFYRFMLTCALDGEACFDVHVHGIVLVYWLVVGCGKIACQGQVVFDIVPLNVGRAVMGRICVFRIETVSCFL